MNNFSTLPKKIQRLKVAIHRESMADNLTGLNVFVNFRKNYINSEQNSFFNANRPINIDRWIKAHTR
jgi:hypothetical protein